MPREPYRSDYERLGNAVLLWLKADHLDSGPCHRRGDQVEGLSAHDLRHTWATRAARNGTPIDRLQDAGGWNSPAMPLRYVEAAKVANEGVRV